MRNNTHGKARYMPGLDGLRALSVLAVIAYHLNWQGAPGGYLGVGVFFVLSGYLITDQLVARWQRDGRLDLKDFWLRRARRLLPAMLLMLAVVSAWLLATDAGRLRSLGGDIGSAVAYVNNWWLIYHKVSYFESFGPPSPFGHFWSLAVEEQFYLVWPLVLVGLLSVLPRRGRLAGAIAAGAAASALAMALLYSPGEDPSRVYYGSDTRVFGLLIGAALAVVWPSAKLKETDGPGARRLLNGVGVASLAAIVYMMAEWSEYDSFVYRGGLVLLSIASAVLVACLAHPSSTIGKVFSAKPLRWIGARSYGIYLWHYPVIALTTPASEAESFDLWRAVLQTAASIALAALSWKYVEEPILRGAWKKGAREFAARTRQRGWARKQATALATASLTIVLCVSCVGTGSVGEANAITAPDGSDGGGSVDAGGSVGIGGGGGSGSDGGNTASSGDGNGGIPISTPEARPGANGGSSVVVIDHPAGGGLIGTGVGTAPGLPKPGTVPASGQKPGSAGTGGKPGSGATSGGAKPAAGGGGSAATGSKPDAGGKDADAPEPQSGKGITVIGDSVILGVKPYLEKLLPGIAVDGEVGRQLSEAQDTIDAHIKAGDMGELVILELGTNGPAGEKRLKKLLDSIGKDRTILIVNTRVPRKWQDDVNDLLKDAAAEYDNATLVDWYSASEGKTEFFGKDGVHLNRKGGEFYAEMLAKAVAKAKG